MGQSLAAAHGLGTCVERLLSQQPLAARDARGPVMRSYTRDLGSWLASTRPHIAIVSGQDMTRHVLAAMRRYRVGSMRELGTYDASKRFVTVEHWWGHGKHGQLLPLTEDGPSPQTVFVPVLDLGIFLSESYKGRPLPNGYWTQWTSELIKLAQSYFKPRPTYDEMIPSVVRRKLEKPRPETPEEALIRDSLGF